MANYQYIKRRKHFYVNSFRKAVLFLFVSLVLNCLLIVGIYYKYITKPARDYYATDGIGAPIQLKSMLQPNYSSQALLPPDPTNLTVQKAIPD